MNFIKIPGKDFEMMATQITQRQWQDGMGTNPSNHNGDDLPVEMVSFNDVQEFIKKLNTNNTEHVYRLPTEEEWEYCCRAGSTTEYCFGDDAKALGDYAWYYENSGNKTHPVAQKKPNAWGLFDMHGNVWEWCDSFYFKDQTESGSYRVIRGGSSYRDSWNVRSALRRGRYPGLRYVGVGGRLVRTLPSALLQSFPCPLSESERAAAARRLIKQIRAKLTKLEKLL